MSHYITSINLILIVLATPSIVNPGPNPKARPLTIFYNNVQDLIDIRDLKSKEPQLNMTKLYKLHGHIFTTKPDVIILNETWLKKSILDTQVLPQNYKIRRVDRTRKTHPWDPSHVLIGDLNFPEIRWPDNVTTVDLHKHFLELLMVDLCHSQLITESTHKQEDSRSSIH